ncbi:hypothetical protein QFC21_005003 [Naganishia friedmannii]|uniref:Uncharacterized protein n=1 Tax=Naganishia friedmannii TaxID=89922 RepID=A0ACC2VC87_9TREE|nr:hypothetical protein QFC21_005003 [Naganishia friedmannii]
MDLGSTAMAATTTYPSPSPPLMDEDLASEPFHHHAHQTRITLALSIISSRGIAISFLSGVTLLSLSLIPILLTHGSLKALRSVIGASGLVWLFITGVVWLLLRPRGTYSRVPVTALDGGGGGVVDFPGMDGGKDDTWDVVRRKVWEGWARVGLLVNGEEIRRLRVTYWYLLASALLQDAFNTTLAVSILFAKTTLGMSPAQVIIVGLLMQLTAVLSSSLTPAIQKRYDLTGIQSILVCVAMGTGMCVYGMIGLVCPWFGMRNTWEMYLCAIWFGMGQEARFFSLFSITDKSASFLGPAAIAAVADLTGEIRYGFGVLALLMVVPVPILLYFVDVERGRKDSRLYATR